MRTLTKTQMNALKKVCSNDPLRPDYESILHEEGRMIATNGHILTVIDADYGKSLEGKMTHKKDDREIEGGFPNYKAVIPSEDITEWLDVDGAKLFEGAKRLNKVKGLTMACIEVENTYYAAKFLFTAMNILKNGKDLKFRRATNYDERPLLMESDGFQALIMPMKKPDDVDEFNRESVEYNGYKSNYSMDEAATFEPFEKTVIAMENGSIFGGEIVGKFEKFGIEYQIVNTKYFTHSVLHGVSQAETGLKYDNFDELIEDTPEETITVNFKVPESAKIDVAYLKNGVADTKKMTIDRIYNVKGLQIYFVEDKPYYRYVYNGYSFERNCETINRLNNLRDPKRLLDDFIEKTYK